MVEKLLRSKEKPPALVPTEEIWNFCEALGKETNTPPIEVLSRLTALGKALVELDRLGVPIVAKCDGKEIGMDVFKK